MVDWPQCRPEFAFWKVTSCTSIDALVSRPDFVNGRRRVCTFESIRYNPAREICCKAQAQRLNQDLLQRRLALLRPVNSNPSSEDERSVSATSLSLAICWHDVLIVFEDI